MLPQIGNRAAPNYLALAGLVCALVGVVIMPIVLGPVGLILSWLGLRRARQGMGWRGVAIAGMVIGGLEFLLLLILVATSAK